MMAPRRDISDYMMMTVNTLIFGGQRLGLVVFCVFALRTNAKTHQYTLSIIIALFGLLALSIHAHLRRSNMRVQVDDAYVYLTRGKREMVLPFTAIERVYAKRPGSRRMCGVLHLREPTLFGQEVQFEVTGQGFSKAVPPSVVELRRLAGLPERS